MTRQTILRELKFKEGLCSINTDTAQVNEIRRERILIMNLRGESCFLLGNLLVEFADVETMMTRPSTYRKFNEDKVKSFQLSEKAKTSADNTRLLLCFGYRGALNLYAISTRVAASPEDVNGRTLRQPERSPRRS
jgi:hypothetical protein